MPNKDSENFAHLDPITETDTELIKTIRPAELFLQESFEALPFGFDITLIVGRPSAQSLIQELINPEKLMVQSIRFKKPPWTIEQALAWIRDNFQNFDSINKLKKYAADLRSINDVEIFSTGVWNGDEYTIDDLKTIVLAFNENKEGFRPPLKLGHNSEQALLQVDGLPAAGWVGELFIKGEKLMANFIDIPKKIFELIENKAYRKVSSEIFWNIKLGENLYKRALSGVALLGCENPGVSNLSDILANYQLTNYNTIKIYKDDLESKIYNQEDKQMPKTEKEIGLEKDLEVQATKNKDLETKIEKFTADKTAQADELKELKEYKEEQDKKNVELAKEAEEAKVKAFVTELKAEKLMSPAMEKYVTELLSEKKEYSIDSKSVSKQDAVKEMLKLFKQASEVNFDENSLEGKKITKNSESAIEERIKKYATENKVNDSEAYRAVMNEMQTESVDDGQE